MPILPHQIAYMLPPNTRYERASGTAIGYLQCRHSGTLHVLRVRGHRPLIPLRSLRHSASLREIIAPLRLRISRFCVRQMMVSPRPIVAGFPGTRGSPFGPPFVTLYRHTCFARTHRRCCTSPSPILPLAIADPASRHRRWWRFASAMSNSVFAVTCHYSRFSPIIVPRSPRLARVIVGLPESLGPAWRSRFGLRRHVAAFKAQEFLRTPRSFAQHHAYRHSASRHHHHSFVTFAPFVVDTPPLSSRDLCNSFRVAVVLRLHTQGVTHFVR